MLEVLKLCVDGVLGAVGSICDVQKEAKDIAEGDGCLFVGLFRQPEERAQSVAGGVGKRTAFGDFRMEAFSEAFRQARGYGQAGAEQSETIATGCGIGRSSLGLAR